MSELLEKILTDASSRDDADMPILASSLAEDFLPWAGLE